MEKQEGGKMPGARCRVWNSIRRGSHLIPKSRFYIILIIHVQVKSLFHSESFHACPLRMRDHVPDRIYGYGEGEAAACAGCALHPDASPVQLHEAFDDGQPQPRTARISRG